MEIYNQSQLNYWEENFKLQLRHIDLVGEIYISLDECNEIGLHLGRQFKSLRREDALKVIESIYPASLAVFLVGQGIYGYKGGDYWSSVEIAMNYDIGNFTSSLGQVFERTLQRYNLPLFPDLQERSARYVSLILAHGGIPLYCLNDYFSHVVFPTIRSPLYDGLAQDEIVEE